MLTFFNEIMDCYKAVMYALFNDMEFAGNVSIGYILLTIAVFAVIIRFVFGRMN